LINHNFQKIPNLSKKWRNIFEASGGVFEGLLKEYLKELVKDSPNNVSKNNVKWESSKENSHFGRKIDFNLKFNDQ
jgi:hypothetical protein